MPRHAANAGVTWRFMPRTQAHAVVQYVGERPFDGDETNTFGRKMPSYTLVDVKITHEERDWRFGAGVRNLFDEKVLQLRCVHGIPDLRRAARARAGGVRHRGVQLPLGLQWQMFEKSPPGGFFAIVQDVPASSSLQLYVRLLRFVKPYRGVFALALLGMMIVAATEPALPALLKPLLDGTFVDKDERIMRLMPILIVAVFVIRGLAE